MQNISTFSIQFLSFMLLNYTHVELISNAKASHQINLNAHSKQTQYIKTKLCNEKYLAHRVLTCIQPTQGLPSINYANLLTKSGSKTHLYERRVKEQNTQTHRHTLSNITFQHK